MSQDPESLLIVDDETMVREVMLRYFSKRGFNVFGESSGRGALEWINTHQVDLVLLDIEMPEIDGLEVLRTLRQIYTPTQLPIIMVTGRSGIDDVTAAMTAGANDYQTKPIDFPRLLGRIQTQLSLKRTEEALHANEGGFPLDTPKTDSSVWD